jgi:hypothetical protein
MAKVVATQPGYFGKVLRAAGEPFEIPDEIWDDEKKRPSWAVLARKSKSVAPAVAPSEPAGDEKPRESKPASAPEPQGNGVKEVLGTAPDWVAPAAAAAPATPAK